MRGDWDLIVARLDKAGEFMPGVAAIGTKADDNGTAIAPLADGGALAAGEQGPRFAGKTHSSSA